MRSLSWSLIWVCVLAGVGVSARVRAQPSSDTPDPTSIMRNVYELSWRNPRMARIQLKSTGASGGDARERALTVRTKGDPKSHKTLVLVESPADLRGTGFVNIEHTDHSDSERWLYLPKLRRATRLAGGQMSTPFLGSDLSFGDLSQQNPELFHFAMASEQPELVDGETCWIIKATPKDPTVQEQLGYSELQIWISRSKLAMVRTRALMLDGKRSKYFQASDFRKLGEAWLPGRVIVRTVEAGKVRSESTMSTTESKVEPTISDDEFTKQRLESGL
jgi:hypothetical protein